MRMVTLRLLPELEGVRFVGGPTCVVLEYIPLPWYGAGSNPLPVVEGEEAANQQAQSGQHSQQNRLQ